MIEAREDAEAAKQDAGNRRPGIDVAQSPGLMNDAYFRFVD